MYCIHVSGHDPLTFSFRSFILFDWVGVLWPQLSKVLKPVRWAGSVPFPQCPCRGRLFAAAAGVHVFISGESLHCFLVGWCTNKSDVIATSDLWLFISCFQPASLTPHTHSPTIIIIIINSHSDKRATTIIGVYVSTLSRLCQHHHQYIDMSSLSPVWNSILPTLATLTISLTLQKYSQNPLVQKKLPPCKNSRNIFQLCK